MGERRGVLVSLSPLGSTVQLKPWPPPCLLIQSGSISCRPLNNFLFYSVRLAPRPTPTLEDQASVFISPRGRVVQLYPHAPDTHFSRLLRHAWVTVGLYLFPGHHTGKVFWCIIINILCKLLASHIYMCVTNWSDIVPLWMETQTTIFSKTPAEQSLKRAVKVKAKLSLCSFLTEHHAMKVYWESGSIAPRILWPLY
jgi:hypothetical protein